MSNGQTMKSDTGRIDRLEAIVEGLADGFSKFQRETSKDIGEIREAVGKMGRVSWPLIVSVVVMFISLAALAVTIGTLVLSPMSSKLDAHVELPGHTEAMKLHAVYAERFDRIFDEIEDAEQQDQRRDDRTMRALERIVDEIGGHQDDIHALELQNAATSANRHTTQDAAKKDDEYELRFSRLEEHMARLEARP